ncbi:Ig-like domain-containing protein, partial [Methylobacterium sp. WSM2598]|uniref:Ig-like domain-containing protein n=1 Tax=Methylobacterium sp. WSM2598 TaxID=398261 RepID=UPI000369BA1B
MTSDAGCIGRPVRAERSPCLASSPREIAFIDPGLDAVEVLRAGLRADVEPILLNASSPALAQIARALHGRAGLAAIHVLAHGSPGAIAFAAGAVTAESVGDNTDELASVGSALGVRGRLLVWSCQAGAGAEGAALTRALEGAVAAPVTVAQVVIGHAALGGTWSLSSDIAGAAAPLTASAQEGYLAVAATQTTSNGTTVENLNVLDTNTANDVGGKEIITWSEVSAFLTSTTNATQTQTLQSAFSAGSLALTFNLGNNVYFTIKHTSAGYVIVQTDQYGYVPGTGPVDPYGTFALGALSDTTAAAVASLNQTYPTLSSFVSAVNSVLGSTSALVTADVDGGAGRDNIQGITSNTAIHNIIQGGAGADVMSGGLGADFFVYTSVNDSPAAGQLNSGGQLSQSWDQITNFSSAQGDKIDLTALGSFAWGGNAGPKAGVPSVWYTSDGNGGSYVLVDADGNGQPDLKIQVVGVTNFSPADILGVDATAAVVSSVVAATTGGAVAGTVDYLNATDKVSVTVTYNEALKVASGPTPTLTLTGGRTATLDAAASDLVHGKLVFTYTVAAGDNVVGLAITGSSLAGVTDLVGNAVTAPANAGLQETGGITLTLDNTVASVSSVVAATTGGSLSSGVDYLNAADKVSVTVTYNEALKVAAGATPTLTLTGSKTAAFDVAASDLAHGKLVFIYTVTTGDNISGLAITNSTLTGVTDLAGNAVAAPTNAILQETSGATITVDTAVASPTVALVSDTGSSSTDEVTSNGALSLTGVESGAAIEYSTNGTTWGSSFAPVEGSNTVYVRQIDKAGNISAPSAAYTFTLDTAATATISLNDITTDNVINAAKAGGPVAVTGSVGGDAKVGDTVTLSVNNATYTGAVVAGGTFSINVQGSDLAADTKVHASITATDTAGNTASASADHSYTVDTLATATISLNDITADNVINAAEAGGTVAVTGSVGGDAKAGDTVTLSVNNATYTGQVVSGGTFSINVQGSDLAAD